MNIDDYKKLDCEDQVAVVTYEQLMFGPAKRATPPEFMCLLDRMPKLGGVVNYEVERLRMGKELGMGWETFHDEETTFELVARARAFEWTEEHRYPTRVLAVMHKRKYNDPTEKKPICYFYIREDESVYVSFLLDNEAVEQRVTYIPSKTLPPPRLISREEILAIVKQSEEIGRKQREKNVG